MTNAQKRRGFAMMMLHELVMPTLPDNAPRVFASYATREFIAGNIEKLAQLGRTEQWKAVIQNWADMVRDEEYDLSWAYAQYSVYASMAL
jgi:hypothetical protein